MASFLAALRRRLHIALCMLSHATRKLSRALLRADTCTRLTIDVLFRLDMIIRGQYIRAVGF